MNREIDFGEITDFMLGTAEMAGKILMSHFRQELTIESKDHRVGGIDIVTNADKEAEEAIIGAIRQNFPGHDILAEETSGQLEGSEFLWVVDPLDGTVNFAHNYPHFAISIALEHKGSIVAGIVSNPVGKENFYAVKGGGAYLNGNEISVSKAAILNRSIVGTGFPYDKAFSDENNLKEFSRVLLKVQGMRRLGSAALDLAYVGCGRLDGFWELKLKPWDVAAGILVVAEASGVVSDRFGKKFDLYSPSILATNGLIHSAMIEVLNS
mgnify:CR=1 FL=1